MSKKILSLISVVMVLAMLAACGGDGGAPATPAGDGEWKWERKIEIVCPWGAGGGAAADHFGARPEHGGQGHGDTGGHSEHQGRAE